MFSLLYPAPPSIHRILPSFTPSASEGGADQGRLKSVMNQRRKKRDVHVKEEEEEQTLVVHQSKHNSAASAAANSTSHPPPPSVFAFWFYLILLVSLITLLFLFLFSYPTTTHDHNNSCFLSLTPSLRSHYSQGILLKTLTHHHHQQQPINVFVLDRRPQPSPTSSHADSVVLLIHGLGCSSFSFRRLAHSLSSHGIRAVAIDLPGSGFSDRFVPDESDRGSSIVDVVWSIYESIKERGIFWGFDHLVETGEIPEADWKSRLQVRISKRQKPIRLDSVETGNVVKQVVDELGVSRAHVLLHDSAVASVDLAYFDFVSSVTIVDGSGKGSFFPIQAVGMIGLREILMSSSLFYHPFLRFCCSMELNKSDAEDHRVLLRYRDGGKAVVEMAKGMNFSFDFADWANSGRMKEVPKQILWSGSWSEEWSEVGRRVATEIPNAKFVSHSWGRWPQEDAAESLAKEIVNFVSSLPKTVAENEGHPPGDGDHMKAYETGDSRYGRHDYGDDQGHDDNHGHDHAAAYPSNFGLGNEGWS